MEANFGRGSFRCNRVRSIRLAKRFENANYIARGRKSLSLLKDVYEDGAKAIEPCGIRMSAFEQSCMKGFTPQTNLFQCCGADRPVGPKRPEEFGYGRSGLVQGRIHFLEANG